MFHPTIIAEREALLTASLGGAIPGGKLVRRSIEECWAYRDQLADVYSDKGVRTRALTQAEDDFITHERLLAPIDYRYWAERYAVVAKEAQDAEPLTPFWQSQELFLGRVAQLEYDHHQQGHPDGILVNVLKARQLGISTITETIMAHGLTTQTAVRGLVAGDVQEQSQYMFGMAEMVIHHLPWWLKPPMGSPTTRGTRITLATGSTLMAFWGKSSRGGLQDRDKAKGNLGRGKTFGRVHLTELSTWERPEQINDALLPGVPMRPRTFVVFESTAKGRYDWWHKHWDQSDRGIGRFTNIFIPWYIEPDKYWLPVPEGWEPLETTKQHAEEVERDSPKWCLGQTVRLEAEQLYWYEQKRRTYDDADAGAEFTVAGERVATFYEEYPASPRDAFQHAGQSIFGPKLLERLKSQETTPRGICEIQPAKDIALLKEWERQKKALEAAIS